MAVALTIAGSDSSGGAGIQADIKALASIGVHAASVITCVTAQNTMKVRGIFPLPPEQVGAQLRAVLEDLEVDAAKTGMLFSAEIAEVVAEGIRGKVIPLVVDPVLDAGVGDKLHRAGLVEALRSELIPLACCVTPNASEAEALTGLRLRDLDGAKRACRQIADLGARSVLIKGGHMPGDPVTDLLFYEDEFVEIRSPRIDVRPHGSGCHLSAYMAGYLGQGVGIREAVIQARGRTDDAMKRHYAIGKGLEMLDSLATIEREAARYQVLAILKDAVASLEGMLSAEWVPGGGCNFAYALPQARYLEDVCGLEGDIIWSEGRANHSGCLAYGAARGLGHVVLRAMERDRDMRCALGLGRSDPNLRALEAAGLRVERLDVPEKGRGRPCKHGPDGLALPIGEMPDAFCERDGEGGSLIYILGKDPADVLGKVEGPMRAR